MKIPSLSIAGSRLSIRKRPRSAGTRRPSASYVGTGDVVRNSGGYSEFESSPLRILADAAHAELERTNAEAATAAVFTHVGRRTHRIVPLTAIKNFSATHTILVELGRAYLRASGQGRIAMARGERADLLTYGLRILFDEKASVAFRVSSAKTLLRLIKANNSDLTESQLTLLLAAMRRVFDANDGHAKRQIELLHAFADSGLARRNEHTVRSLPELVDMLHQAFEEACEPPSHWVNATTLATLSRLVQGVDPAEITFIEAAQNLLSRFKSTPLQNRERALHAELLKSVDAVRQRSIRAELIRTLSEQNASPKQKAVFLYTYLQRPGGFDQAHGRPLAGFTEKQMDALITHATPLLSHFQAQPRFHKDLSSAMASYSGGNSAHDKG